MQPACRNTASNSSPGVYQRYAVLVVVKRPCDSVEKWKRSAHKIRKQITNWRVEDSLMEQWMPDEPYDSNEAGW